LLSCRIASDEVGSDRVCCRLAAFHQEVTPRIRRYPSDTTDAQWALIDPLLPDPAWLGEHGGRPEQYCRRVIVDAIFYLVDNGTKWRALPVDFPPWSTVYNYFAAWEKAGVTQYVLDGLRDRVRLRDGRTAQPSAAIIDSQSLKAAETVGWPTRGYDAGKRSTAVNATSRWTRWACCCVCWSPPRTGPRRCPPLLEQLTASCRRIRLIWADGGYAGTLVDWARTSLTIVLQIVKRSDDATGFVVLPRRWVVERTLAWITRHRRCVRDYERLPAHHEAMVRWSMIRTTSRRLTTNRV
jgi:transposase